MATWASPQAKPRNLPAIDRDLSPQANKKSWKTTADSTKSSNGTSESYHDTNEAVADPTMYRYIATKTISRVKRLTKMNFKVSPDGALCLARPTES